MCMSSVIVKCQHFLAILESGVDINVLGKDWFIETTHPTLTANVQAFDGTLAI